MEMFRFLVFITCSFAIQLAFSDQMVGRPYDGEVQECYVAHQKISANPTTQSLYSQIGKICTEKGGSKVAYKIEELNMTESHTILFVCFQNQDSAMIPIFGCRYYLTGFSL